MDAPFVIAEPVSPRNESVAVKPTESGVRFVIGPRAKAFDPGSNEQRGVVFAQLEQYRNQRPERLQDDRMVAACRRSFSLIDKGERRRQVVAPSGLHRGEL